MLLREAPGRGLHIMLRFFTTILMLVAKKSHYFVKLSLKILLVECLLNIVSKFEEK